MADKAGNDTLTFLNDFIDWDVSDKSYVAFGVTGTWVATLTWTGSIDGANYFAIFPLQSAVASITANAALTMLPAMGLTRIRVTATAYTSGTATLTWITQADSLSVISNMPNSGTTVGLNPGTAATALGKAEDAPAVTGDTGIAVWGVRNDTEIGRASCRERV